MAASSDPGFIRWVEEMFGDPAKMSGGRVRTARNRNAAPRPDVLLARLTRLFEDAPRALASYSPAQAGEGLWTVFDASRSDCLRPLLDGRMGTSARVRCIRAIVRLYSQFLAKHCVERLGHSETTTDPLPSLNRTCYMLWDLAILRPQKRIPDPAIDDACLGVMREALSIPHISCQESALHGLGHWQSAYPTRVAAIVDEFAGTKAMAPALLAYARAAREGAVS